MRTLVYASPLMKGHEVREACKRIRQREGVKTVMMGAVLVNMNNRKEAAGKEA